MAFFNERDYYEIPLDCLRPAGAGQRACGRPLPLRRGGRDDFGPRDRHRTGHRLGGGNRRRLPGRGPLR